VVLKTFLLASLLVIMLTLSSFISFNCLFKGAIENQDENGKAQNTEIAS